MIRNKLDNKFIYLLSAVSILISLLGNTIIHYLFLIVGISLAVFAFKKIELKVFLKNLYSIYLTIYLLWWVSVFIIISDEGFHPVQDIPWFILFTTILFIFWVIKYKVSSDRKFIFHENISSINLISHLLIILVLSILMVFFS